MPVSLEATRGGGPGSTWSLGEPVIASCRMMRTAEPSRVPQFQRAPGRSQKIKVRKISFWCL